MICDEAIVRLLSAGEPSREIDAMIHRILVGEVVTGVLSGYWLEDGSAQIPEYTGSVDAAMALKERAIPEWRIVSLSQTDTAERSFWMCRLSSGDMSHPQQTVEGRPAATAALALCSVILRACNRIEEIRQQRRMGKSAGQEHWTSRTHNSSRREGY